MRQTWKLLFCIVFVVLCAFPVFTMPFFGSDGKAENRTLAPAPALVDEQGQLNPDFFNQVNDYLSDHFVLRSSAVAALGLLKANLFATSNEDQVILGQDGWLYFDKTLGDYRGTAVLSDSEIDRIAATLGLIEEHVTARGGNFLFFVAPNKNTVYPQYMPYQYLPSDSDSNLDKLNAVLDGSQGYLNLLPLLDTRDQQLYHKRDSHWNNLGAVICYQAVMERLGLPANDYAPFTLQTQVWSGDLDKMLFPSLGYLDEQWISAYNFNYEYTSRFRSEEDLTIQTADAESKGHLLMFRDSFCNALLPMFAESFATAEFSRITPYRINLMQGADTVVIELVERNIPNLLKAAPVMEAPQRSDRAGAVSAQGAQVFTRTSQGMLHVYGTADPNARQFYLQVTDGETSTVYEAFPIYEAQLIDGEDAVKNGGFSAYLPYDSADGLTIELFTK